jgi:uncharacterized protein (DUF3084 family)
MTEREQLQARLAKAQERFRDATAQQQDAQIEIDDISREIARLDERAHPRIENDNVSADPAGSMNPHE